MVTESFLQQSQNSSEGTCAIALPAQQSKADIKLCSLFLQGRYSQVNGGGGGARGDIQCLYLEEVKTWTKLEMRVNVY